MRKSGFVGEHQINLVKGYAGVLSWIGNVKNINRFTDIELIFYSTVFQSGIQQYIFPESVSEKTPTAGFINTRTKYLSTKKSQAIREIDAIFLHYLPSLPTIYGIFERYSKIKLENDKDYEATVTEEDILVKKHEEIPEIDELVRQISAPVAVATLHTFLTELIIAMENTASMITISGIPTLDGVGTILPDEVLIPIKNLLSCITPEQAVVLNPSHIITSENIRIFNEIIASKQFVKYSTAQLSLEDAQFPTQSCISKISAMASDVFESSSSSTSLKKIGLGIIALSEQIVDAKFGKIPSALTKALNIIFGEMLTKILEERRRVVIYNFADSMGDLFKNNALRMIDADPSNQTQQR
jgi:hypothetical protein